jgi:hydrogenase maturation protease
MRVLVAGIGNVLLGDDGFGVEVVRRLASRALPEGVAARDFGIRGVDLAYALSDGWDAAILVDAAARGGAPGTLYVIDPSVASAAPAVDGHALDPASVLAYVRAVGGALPASLRVVACEPAHIPADDEIEMGLSAPVDAAVDAAVRVVASLVDELCAPRDEAACTS